jgi:hypothetical protein
MDLYFGTALVVVLLVAFIAARRAFRRQKPRQRPRTAVPGQGMGKASARSDMRAYDETNTLIDAVGRGARSTAPQRTPPPARNPDTQRKKS